jgi:hypothetical protein
MEHYKWGTLGRTTLHEIRSVFVGTGFSHYLVKDMTIELAKRGDPWSHLWQVDLNQGRIGNAAAKLANILRPYGIESEPISGHRCYTRKAFEKVWAEELPPLNGESNEIALMCANMEKHTILIWVDTHGIQSAAYCRPVSQRDVDAMVRAWDFNQCNVIAVSKRADGSLWILDGKHRLTAAIMRGVPRLPARVFTGLTYQQEAALFVELNKKRNVQPIDRFLAKVEARDITAIAIVNLMGRHGLIIGRSSSTHVRAVASLEWLYSDSPENLEWIIDVLHAAYGMNARAYTGATLEGMAAVLKQPFAGTIDRGRAVKVLQKAGLEVMMQKAAVLTTITKHPPSAFGRAFVEMYNAHVRFANKLPEWVEKRVRPKSPYAMPKGDQPHA